MRLPLSAGIALALATALLALPAANANSGGARQAGLATAAPTGKVSVKYTITKFARRGSGVVAYGTATARYIPGSAGGEAVTSRTSFRAPVKIRSARGHRIAAATTICPVLTLDLQQLDLNLLGLVVHADRVFLTIKADSEGGLLGQLLCGLTKSGKLAQQTAQLNYAVKKSGLAVGGTGFTVAVAPAVASGGNATPNAVRPLALCPVLELTLGPLDANLLGLLVHLDQVHLTIVADSEGGILGSLFCSVAGGGAPA
jgi:hypothetical protein